jgi:hypothetical protein
MKLIVKTLALGAALFMVGCATPNASKLGDSTLQIQRGMSYQQVLSIVSDYPVERTFNGRGTALQYCIADKMAERSAYAVVWMVDDKVEGLTQYDRYTGWFSCQNHFREVDWGQAPADVKIALDIR